MFEFAPLNILAIVVAFLINIIVGMLWYSPLMFGGKRWLSMTGIDMKKIPMPEANRGIGLTALAALTQAIVLALIVGLTGSHTALQGIVLGLILWAGFIAGSTVGDTVYARRGIRLFGANTAYFFVVLVINAVILSVWR